MGCIKCGGKLILGQVGIDLIEPDQEPYESGEIVEMEPIEIYASLHVHYCENCERIHDIWSDDGEHLIATTNRRGNERNSPKIPPEITIDSKRHEKGE